MKEGATAVAPVQLLTVPEPLGHLHAHSIPTEAIASEFLPTPFQEETVRSVADVDPIVAAHIHDGDATVAGPVVVNFNVAVNGLSGCIADVAADLIKDIRQNPSEYYVNVHNAVFPAGALRGQLSK